ncbi:hypothetical protein MSIMFB_02768 [Mycobacterium simulans]|uniref:Uncharacterized protein n=1 Tax=Mycobacterium simulans TaxID=627089 RepID=A0A7Z7N9Z0_9MYCO|nr:hypothetical protein MSIMFB_02768 [Mycobacterium simulans]SON58574.1 hypothetical protein MSIMFI_00052 [Mycobacterium simulans]
MGDHRFPAMILSGLAAGLVFACIGAVVVWPAAPALPFILGMATMPFPKAKAFALGAWAAACGVLAFLITLAVLLLI